MSKPDLRRGEEESGGPGPSSSLSSPAPKPPITVTQQFLAASGASIAAAVVVNPLDVVKTRLQTQAAAMESVSEVGRGGPTSTSSSGRAAAVDAWNMFSCPPRCGRASGSLEGLCGTQCRTYNTTFGMLSKIMRTEGYKALWKGTGTSVIMAVPLVGIYMPLYDNLLAEFRRSGMENSVAAPLLAGCISRAVSVFCVGPLELLRTRQQAQVGPAEGVALFGGGGAASSLSGLLGAGRGGGGFGMVGGGAAAILPPAQAQAVLSSSSADLKLGFTGSLRLASLWRGTSATLLRDIPFSAMYWTAVETSREALKPWLGIPTGDEGDEGTSTAQLLAVNMIAGTGSGALAAAITTPLDVVKTRMQTSPLQRKRGVAETVAEIYGGGGWRAFLTGVGPRAVRAAPACAIVISSYELLKAMLVLHQ